MEIEIKCPNCKWTSKLKLEQTNIKQCPVCKKSVATENTHSNKTILKD